MRGCGSCWRSAVKRVVMLTFRGAATAANPESSGKYGERIWIPDRCRSASKTRVNALMAASGMT